MKKQDERKDDEWLAPVYGSRWDMSSMAKTDIPDDSMRGDQAFQIIRDEMGLQGNPSLNLATFVTTWMEPEAERLMQLGAMYNLIDEDEYPQLKIIEDRLIRMQASLFHAPKENDPVGMTTSGSSEAIMLGLLAHKWQWRKHRRDKGLGDSRPNIIFGADVHTCWEKFARYFDVDMKIIPMKPGKYTINAHDVQPLLDEYTIAVGGIVGTTFTGQVDDVASINQLLIEHKKKTGQDIPIHIDAASGGFVMPFANPDFAWDFRLEQVRSINVSNHKFGLVYAGLGSLIFKDKKDLPKDLPFKINYLGGAMDNYSLNFSKSSSMLLAQYYNFLRFGKEGYQRIIDAVMHNAVILENYLTDSGHFEVLTDTKFLPIVVVKLKEEFGFTVFDISGELKKYGWIIPAYSLPAEAEDISVLRMVIKENFSHDLAEKLISDIKEVIRNLQGQTTSKPTVVKEHRSKTKPHHIC
ncbi:glutamate decarboxylase [Legionella spiritensis]|uniref:Glutamate decarboxylase n=1 Tax=Legionella spiritensis TaxID=452 RepID=A0A0W0YW48_LEGSP|nr:glutamate decarboxylase [Legionella spiritensis]KTD61141.1 glutamate decarboxylase B, PLP-dependent [Legionella spiritensis]SNV45166.1 glutamate decarboxylase B, PLP-dependent [Legionella spiritensis]